jgi:hypothetical protein
VLWLQWRQHRLELLVTALLLGLLAVPLIITGTALHEQYGTDGVAACVTDPAHRAGCGQIVDLFLARHTEWGNRFIWVTLLPVLVGVFIGAPLLAREYEHGTDRLAFTQSITRTRWVTTKLATVGGGAAIAAALAAALFTWWRAPLDAIGGRMRTAAFAVGAPSLIAVTLFAFATGVLAGALIRRTIAAMGATLGAFLAVRLTMEEVVRPHYLTPLTRVTLPGTGSAADAAWHPSTEWVVNTGWIDSSGRLLADGEKAAIIRQIYGTNDTAAASSAATERYLADHGLRHYTEYHLNSSFWAFQAIEAAVYLGLAAILVTAAIWTVRRRTT